MYRARKEITYAEGLKIPTRVIDFEEWRRERGVKKSDLHAREAYFEEVLAVMREWGAELIILSGCMLLVTNPLLSAYWERILNVHPTLLGILDEKGERKYRGLGVVKRAMDAGDPTGSTVHFITGEPDMGPIVVESAPLPYQPGDDPEAHQDLMKVACDGPAYQRALEILCTSGLLMRLRTINA
jgi:phosphoribosylglycinamide formyltransferase 1